MYCNNCGDKGHVFRSCTHPVISCGILFLRGIFEPLELPADPKTVSVLMVRRKDSMSYMEFIRGKYDTRDREYIKCQLQNMTVQEQNLIVSETFETLWSKMWGNGRDIDGHEYEVARDKFNSLDRKQLVSSVKSQFTEPEWGFPKGRRMKRESDIQCAIREFFEETNIPNAAFTVREDLTFTETFTGTNNIKYKHVYFIVLLKDSRYIDLSQKFTPSQRREISSIGWKTLSECKNITRPHYVERKQLISELERIVSLASK